MEKEKCELDTMEFRCHLESIVRNGVFLYLEGRLSSPDEICCHCLNEDQTYMPDYVTDEVGNLIELRYDKIAYY